MRRSFVGSPARAQDSASSRMTMVRGARARTLAPTSSGMGSRGQECPRHMGWLPPFAQNAKGWRTKLSSRSLCQHERGRSRLHRRERNFADSRVRTTRTSWIVYSRFLAAEAARSDNEKGRLFGTLRPRSGQAQELKSCASRNVRGRGRPRHATPPRHTRFAPQSILLDCRRMGCDMP